MQSKNDLQKITRIMTYLKWQRYMGLDFMQADVIGGC